MTENTPHDATEWRKLKQVCNLKGVPIPNLFMRCGNYYSQFAVSGKRIIRRLPGPTQKEALAELEQRRRKYDAVRNGFVPMPVLDKPVKLATIGEIIGAYRKMAADRNHPRPETVTVNCNALLHLVKKGASLDEAGAERESAKVLTDDLLERYASAMNAGKEGAARVSADRSIMSRIRAARSVFVLPHKLKGCRLPPLKHFLKRNPVQEVAVQYTMPGADVCAATIKAGRELGNIEHRTSNTEHRSEEECQALARVWVLVYDLGLRAEEAAAAHGGWIIQQTDADGRVWRLMEIRDRPEENFQGKSSRSRATRRRYIPIPEAVAVFLMEHPAPWVPGSTVAAREQFVKRNFSAWLRGVHPYWEGQQKSAHELRKLRGCYWAKEFGLSQAHAWLGHSSYQTTLDHYNDQPLQPEPQRMWDEAFRLRWRAG
jgi:hypothetical protein